MDETLGDSDNEELILIILSAVVRCELSQVLSNLGVVCSSSNQTKREDCAHRNLRVRFICKLTEPIHGCDLWVGHSQETNGQWNSSLNDWLSIVIEMIHHPETHLCSSLLTKCNERDSKHSGLLMDGLFLISLVL